MSEVVSIRATVMWAQLERKNEMSEKYQVDLTQLTDKAVDALEGMGIDVGFTDEKQHFITCKSVRPIRAKDADGASLEGINIGNGSLAVGRVKPYSWKFKNKEGVSPSLERLVVTDLVEYEEMDIDPADLDEAL